MIIEASQVVGLNVVTTSGQTVGVVDCCVFDGKEASLIGFQIAIPGIVKKFKGLGFIDTIKISRQQVVIDSADVLQDDLGNFDELFKTYGPILAVTARTESNKKIGKVSDVMIDSETGIITRFYLRQLLHERIIPRQFLVAISPQAVVFKDVVDQPIFNQAATAEAL